MVECSKDTRWGVMLLCRGAIGVFYSPTQLTKQSNFFKKNLYTKINLIIIYFRNTKAPLFLAWLQLIFLWYSWKDFELNLSKIGLMSSVFTHGPEDLGSIPGRVLPKTFKKWYLIPPCLTLSIIRYVSRVKWSNPGKEVVPFPTPWCSRY